MRRLVLGPLFFLLVVVSIPFLNAQCPQAESRTAMCLKPGASRLASVVMFGEPVCVTCPEPYKKFVCVDGQFLCGLENSGCSVGSDVAGCPNPGCPGMTPITPNGGNCQGNCWCSSKVDITASDTAFVNVPVKVTFTTHDRVAHVDGTYRNPVGTPGGTIDWGDKTTTAAGIDVMPNIPHVYKKPGKYTITIKTGGQFHWSAQGGSCSFYCVATGAKEITVVSRKK